MKYCNRTEIFISVCNVLDTVLLPVYAVCSAEGQ